MGDERLLFVREKKKRKPTRKVLDKEGSNRRVCQPRAECDAGRLHSKGNGD